MYDLGKHFEVDLEKAHANTESVIQGDKYRITLLKENVIRFEYSDVSKFNDMPTENVLYRNFAKPEFTIKEDNDYLEITTKYVKINYNKNKDFDGGKINPAKNLSVKILNTDKFWYYNHPEARNIGYPSGKANTSNASKVDKLSDVKTTKGLFSFDGFVTLDDSKSLVFTSNGILEPLERGIDIYLFVYLNDYEKCIKDYYDITGYPSLVPRYALGNWWNKNDDYNDYTLNELLDNFRNNRIPLSVMMLNNSWHIMPLYKTKLKSCKQVRLKKFL